jgi:hypothetical protein
MSLIKPSFSIDQRFRIAAVDQKKMRNVVTRRARTAFSA